jgi:hypothetical protein
MQNDIGYFQIGHDNLPEQPGKVENQTESAQDPGTFLVAIEKQFMTEESHQQTTDNSQGKVKGIEHTRQQDPE